MADDADQKHDAQGQDGSGQDKSGQNKSAEDKPGQNKSAQGGGGDQKPPPPDPPRPRWPWFVAGAVVLVFVAVLLLIILLPHARVKTEDAYVTGHYAFVAPRVGGQIAQVAVDDNQPVRAGQLLAAIDDRDLRTAEAQAEANLLADRARIDQARAQVARQPALIDQATAQVRSARARLGLAEADAARYTDLARTGAGTFQQHQRADAELRQEQAGLAQAEAERETQRRMLDALRAEVAAATARVGQDEAALAQARLNLSYTRILAPIDGIVGQKTVQVGNIVSPGAPLMTVVPLQALYVMADYREVELRHMRPGQPARIHLDAYDVELAGTVASLPPASGATFSPIPPSNATGNFTKIVQRLPVKIVVNPHQPLARLLRAGMSVEVIVDTHLDDVVAAQRNSAGWVTAP